MSHRPSPKVLHGIERSYRHKRERRPDLHNRRRELQASIHRLEGYPRRSSAQEILLIDQRIELNDLNVLLIAA